MIVVKRDGRKVKFNEEKIKEALMGAYTEVYGEPIQKEIEEVTKNVVTHLHNEDFISVEEIQDVVEKTLMLLKPEVAKAYIIYRKDRERVRNSNSALMKQVREKLMATNVQNQNANVDEKSFGGRVGEVSDAVLKQYALDNCMSKMARDNHLNNEIYTHDLNSYAIGSHNCLSIPFDDLLEKGFKTRQVDIRPARSVNTAFQLVAVIFQLQSLQQFGGCSATHIDWTMIPYVRLSFKKHYLDGLEFIEELNEEQLQEMKKHIPDNTGIENEEYKTYNKVYKYALKMTKKEIYQATEALFHNLNSLQSRSGNQLPFTSINFGTCTEPEGRLVIKALLETSIKGVGPLHKTPVFPCSIFQCMKGINRKEGEPNYDLFLLALKSTSLRLYPNYCNVDWSVNEGYDRNDPRTYTSTMGK